MEHPRQAFHQVFQFRDKLQLADADLYPGQALRQNIFNQPHRILDDLYFLGRLSNPKIPECKADIFDAVRVHMLPQLFIAGDGQLVFLQRERSGCALNLLLKQEVRVIGILMRDNVLHG